MTYDSLLLLSSFLFLSFSTVNAQGDALVQPTIIDSSNGELDTTITIEYTDHSGPFYSFTNARWLNGVIPGPTLRLEAGDTLKILFDNQLDQQSGTDFGENEFTKPDHSNLHFHGAHVSGELPSDDVRVPVDPGAFYEYESHFPSNHMPGTHWIHPHVHGSSSLQVGGGAAMAFIVKDPSDYLPSQVEDAEDVLLFVQHMDFDELNEIINAHNDGMLTASVDNGSPTDFRLVNGQYQPDLSMQPGEWQRWRVVMAGWLNDHLNFEIDSAGACEMQLLAKDGIYISDYPREVTILPLPTGARADVMVRCSSAGTYNVLDFSGATIMSISVGGATISSTDLESWTPSYPDYLTDLQNTPADDGCSCSTSFGGCGGGKICVNDILFDEHVYLHTVAFGSVVERTLGGITNHPYHQHVYPFQITNIRRLDDDTHATFYQVGDWHDVVQMDARSVLVRYRADVHTGTIMVHCHILPHEDEGTMTQEIVIDGGECSCDALYTEGDDDGGTDDGDTDDGDTDDGDDGGGSSGGGGSTCFSPEVTTSVLGKGVVPMKELQVGDKVLTSGGDFLPVYALDHFHKTKPTEFLQIHTTTLGEENTQHQPLEVTSLHMIFVAGKNHPTPAYRLQVGDSIQTLKDDETHGFSEEQITRIDKVIRNGFYNALTPDGTIVVNDRIVASTYPALLGKENALEAFGMTLSQHSFLHFALSPLRVLCTTSTMTSNILPKGICSNNEANDSLVNDESYFAWYSQLHTIFFQGLKKQSEVVQVTMVILAILMLGTLSLFSTVFFESSFLAMASIAAVGMTAMMWYYCHGGFQKKCVTAGGSKPKR